MKLHNLDPVEYLRSVVASICNGGDQNVNEVHIKQIQNIWSRTAFPPERLSQSLKAIRLLGEIENIGKGYWLATPTRAVQVNTDKLMVIAIAPTRELQRHLIGVKRAGLGRLSDKSSTHNLPYQSFQSWSGIAEKHAEILIKRLIGSEDSSFENSTIPPGIEVFGIRTIKRQGESERRIPTWNPVFDRNASKTNVVSLFRENTGSNKYRFFIGKQGRNRKILEGPGISDRLGIQYGLAYYQGEPLTASIIKSKNSLNISLPISAPFYLRRVLVALCESDIGFYGREWVCRQPSCWAVIRTALKNIGCEIQEYDQ